MMGDMIEQVAQAIYECAKQQDYVSNYKHYGMDGQFDLADLARAAIEAMRGDVPNPSFRVFPCPPTEDQVMAIWHYMIDEALK